MSVVSNSSPLIYLSALGDLELVRTLFGTAVIPTAVFTEVVIDGCALAGSAEIESAMLEGWITVASINDHMKVSEVQSRGRMHLGEAEAIVLAGAGSSDAILLDDQRAVLEANRIGLKVVRTPALYIAAKQFGLFSSIRPKLDALRLAGFRLRDLDYSAVLHAAGESLD